MSHHFKSLPRRIICILCGLLLIAPAAFADYQSDRVWLEALHPNVIYNLDTEVYIYERNRCDADTCTNGRRDRSGFVWFVALGAFLADRNSQCVGYLHGGLGLGNGVSNNWFMDWSGYDAGACNGNLRSLGQGKGHGTALQDRRWYRLRIWRTSWNGYTGCWGFWIKDVASGREHGAGSWCVRGAYQLINPHQFIEIAEDDPCVTDIWGVHSRNPRFRDYDGFWKFSHGQISYENRCANTYLRALSSTYWIDDREATRHNRSGDRIW